MDDGKERLRGMSDDSSEKRGTELSRRELFGLGAGVPLLMDSSGAGEVGRDEEPALWFDYPGDERSGPFTVGTVGFRATCCAEQILDCVRCSFGADPDLDPTVHQGMQPKGDRGVIAIDIELVRGEWLTRLGKGRWGLVIVPERRTTEAEIREALGLIAPVSAWTMLAYDPFSVALLPAGFEGPQGGPSLWARLAIHIQRYPTLQKALGLLPRKAVITGVVVEGKKSVMLTGGYGDHEEPGLIGTMVHVVHPARLQAEVDEYLEEIRRCSREDPVPCVGLSTADPDFPDFRERVRKVVVWVYEI